MEKKPDFKLIDAFLTDTRGYDESSELTQLKAENERLKAKMQEYALTQIQKDREETKRLMNDKLKDFEGMNPEIESIIDRHIILD